MSFQRVLAVLACALSVGVAPAAWAEAAGGAAVQQQLEVLQTRMQQLEERLQATNEDLAVANTRVQAQEELLKNQTPDVAGGAADFFNRLEIGGWLSGSYWYNGNDPDNDNLFGANSGFTGCCNPFNPDANQFSFDQFWLEVEHPVDPENRAGFRFDIAYGKVAGLLPVGNTPNAGRAGGNNFYIAQAFVQYLADTALGDVLIKAGKFGTLLGLEVAQTTGNWNISRSNVYNRLQPIDHVGVLLSGNIDETWQWALGLVNNVFTTQATRTDGKAITGKVAWSGEKLSAALSGIWGQESGLATTTFPNFSAACIAAGLTADFSACDSGGNEDVHIGIIDIILQYAVNEALTLALNGDYVVLDADGADDPQAWGLAAYANYRWSDRFGTTLRVDLVKDDHDYFGMVAGQIARAGGGAAFVAPASGFLDPLHDSTIYSVTLTGDYSVTDNLLVRGEVRYDNAHIDNYTDDVFVTDGDRLVFGDNDQWLAGAEIVYTF